MKERPILFSSPMVRAILDGSKTQTRRVVKLRQLSGSYYEGGAAGVDFDGFRIPREGGPAPAKFSAEAVGGGAYMNEEIYCPYGQPGDRLWVRETWMPKISHSCGDDVCDCETVYVNYPAGGEGMYFHGGIPEEWVMPEAAMRGKSVPSIHMPRWASRILLEIVSVRVERLHDLSEGDAVAEGIERMPCAVPDTKLWKNYNPGNGCTPSMSIPQNSFRSLWESINGEENWLSNPFVWVVEFKRVTP